ncbi:MAG: hypothetical protein OXI51_02430 [Chloroflexota bacterium]|nr:hypothetical protein [Chloroflexota bacterium]
MVPDFTEGGLLPPGVHWVAWGEIVKRFGGTPWRRQLLEGLRSALENLRDAGCQTAYIDGSFITSKDLPGDFDACWEEQGVDPDLLDPVLLDFDQGRAAQKATYLGEMFPASAPAIENGLSFLEFFQTDKESGERKGIIAIDLGGFT